MATDFQLLRLRPTDSTNDPQSLSAPISRLWRVPTPLRSNRSIPA